MHARSEERSSLGAVGLALGAYVRASVLQPQESVSQSFNPLLPLTLDNASLGISSPPQALLVR